MKTAPSAECRYARQAAMRSKAEVARKTAFSQLNKDSGSGAGVLVWMRFILKFMYTLEKQSMLQPVYWRLLQKGK